MPFEHDDMSYSRQANRSAEALAVAASPTCVQVPTLQSASEVHGAAQNPPGSRAPSTHQFITQPAVAAQSFAAVQGVDSALSPQETTNNITAISLPIVVAPFEPEA